MDQTITMTKAEFEAAIAAGAEKALKAQEGGGIRILKKVTERKAWVRFVDNKAVIGFRNVGSENRPRFVYEEVNPRDPNDRITYVELILEGMKEGDKAIKVPYKQFREESHKAECKIIRREEKEWTINQGMVKKREVEGYSAVELDFDVPVDVVGKTTIFIMEVPAEFGGPREVAIHENYLNIS